MIWAGLLSLWGRAQGWLIAAGAAIAVVGAAFMAGRRGVRAEAERDALREALDARRTRDEVDRNVAREPDAAGELRERWQRRD